MIGMNVSESMSTLKQHKYNVVVEGMMNGNESH